MAVNAAGKFRYVEMGRMTEFCELTHVGSRFTTPSAVLAYRSGVTGNAGGDRLVLNQSLPSGHALGKLADDVDQRLEDGVVMTRSPVLDCHPLVIPEPSTGRQHLLSVKRHSGQ